VYSTEPPQGLPIYRVKRQAALFRLFGYDKKGKVVEETIWRVEKRKE
jgi:hypothetical protein